MRLFSGTRGHRKPNPKQNCLQNYWDHMNAIEHDAHKLWNETNSSNWFKVLAREAWTGLNMSDALRDGHDYMDEAVGLVAGSTIYSAIATGLLCKALWETACGLAITIGLAKDDGQSHSGNIVKALCFALAAYVMSVVVYLKAAISLISRPLVTALVGWKPQDTNRFYDKEQRFDDIIILDAKGMAM